MLVVAEGPPDKRTGAPTPLKVILTTGNAEVRTTLLNKAPLAYLYYFLELCFSYFGLYMNIINTLTPHVYFKSPPTKPNCLRVCHPSKPNCFSKT